MIFIEFPDQGKEWSIDATLSFTNGNESDSTEYKVEKGSNISDHIDNKQQTLEISGFMSDAPFSAEGVYDPVNLGEHLNFFDAVKTAMANKELVIVDAEYKDIWENMQIVSFPPAWGAGTGNGYNFSLSLKQIEFATAQKSRVGPTSPNKSTNARFSPQRSVGAVSPVEATTEQNALVSSAGSYDGVTPGTDFVAGA
jgi:hypothetical protein